jgi:hypothetical protein
LRTGLQPVFAIYTNVAPADERASEVFAPTFFPSTPDRSAAQVLDVKPGQEAEAEFALTPVRSFRVSGTLIGVQGPARIGCEDSTGEQFGARQQIDRRTGRFTVSFLPAGSYRMFVHSQLSQSEALYAEQAVDLSGSNVDGLQLALMPIAPIPIHISDAGASGTTAAAPPPVQVQLTSKDTDRIHARTYGAQRRPAPQGPLPLYDVLPGEYKVLAQSFGDSCIQSVTSGNMDLSRNDLTVTAGSSSQPIEVTVRHDCATISGTVHSEPPQPSGMVVLVPDSDLTEPKLAFVQSNGSFSLMGVSPGEYQVYGFSNIDGLEYANRDALRDFTSEHVSLGPSQKTQVDLKMNLREEN